MDRTYRRSKAAESPLHPATARHLDGMTPTTRGESGYVTLLTARTTLGSVIDLIAVERAVNGTIDPADITRAEGQAAARILLHRGVSLAEIERRTGVLASYMTQGDPGTALNTSIGKRNPHPQRPCGTTAAYQRHRRRGEEPCESCRAANAARDRRDRARKAGRAA